MKNLIVTKTTLLSIDNKSSHICFHLCEVWNHLITIIIIITLKNKKVIVYFLNICLYFYVILNKIKSEDDDDSLVNIKKKPRIVYQIWSERQQFRDIFRYGLPH